MDFKSNGISWADNIYQQLEAMCQEVYEEVDGNMIQEKAKYVESQVQTGCDNIRKFCTEIMQDLLLPPACDVKGPVSDLSVIYAFDVGACKKSKAGCPMEKTLPPAELDAFVSALKGSSPSLLLDGSNNLNRVEDCAGQLQQPFPPSVEATECIDSIEARENHSSNSDAFDAMSRALLSDTLPSTDVNARSNDFDWEEASMSSYMIEPSTEIIEEFEDVKFDEDSSALESGKHGICFISQEERKKRSFKKKLQNMFTSKLHSMKHNHKQLVHCGGGNSTEAECSTKISMSAASMRDSDSKKLLSHDFSEPEWELL